MVKKAVTVREKAEKSAQSQSKKKNGALRLSLQYIGSPFRWLGRKLGKLGRFKVVRIIGYIFWPKYFRNSWKELKQVTWTTRRETWQLTLAVIIFSVIFGVIIAIVDFGLDKAFKEVLLK